MGFRMTLARTMRIEMATVRNAHRDVLDTIFDGMVDEGLRTMLTMNFSNDPDQMRRSRIMHFFIDGVIPGFWDLYAVVLFLVMDRRNLTRTTILLGRTHHVDVHRCLLLINL